MAKINCWYCECKHPPPTGKYCVFKVWEDERLELIDMEDEIQENMQGNEIQGTSSSQTEGTGIIHSMPENTAQPTITDSPIILPPTRVDQATGVSDTLNSTRRSNSSRGSNRSRYSVSDDVMAALDSMNRKMNMMMHNQAEDRERLDRLTKKFEHPIERNVSNFLIPTSFGYHTLPQLNNSTNFISCFTQAPPIMSQLSLSRANTGTGTYATHSSQWGPVVTETVQPSLKALRGDPRLVQDTRQRVAELDHTLLGTVNSNNKKSRGLTRAGGESSQHVFTEWPHDHVLVGPDQERIFYRDLSLEQWSYGYTSIMERQTDPMVKDNMLTHLKNSFLDTILYGFRKAKGAHAKILTDMEDGRYSWHEPEKIADTRRTHAQLPVSYDDKANSHKKADCSCHCERNHDGEPTRYKRQRRNSSPRKNRAKRQVKICKFYNEESCMYDNDHQKGNTIWRHACAQCKEDGHRVTKCRQAEHHSKN
jgi:hypothetical protein